MTVRIIFNPNVAENVLDDLARELPVIIAEVLEVAGGKVAILKRDQMALEFTQSSPRDTGADIRIIVYARDVTPRTSTSENQALTILDKISPLVAASGSEYSVNVRLYYMEIRAAEH